LLVLAVGADGESTHGWTKVAAASGLRAVSRRTQKKYDLDVAGVTTPVLACRAFMASAIEK
jgi:hypothetical protein